MESDAKFRERMTCGFKYDMRNLVSFYSTTQKSGNFFSMGSFYPKFEFQKYRGVTTVL